jgi:hypothetical protein
MRAHATLVLASSIAVVACGGAAPPPSAASDAPSRTAPAKGDAKVDDAAKKTAALEKLTAGEAKSGTCSEGHKAALEKLLSDLETAMTTKTSDDGKPLDLDVIVKKVVALGASPKATEMTVSGRGAELHVLAFGARDVSMDVLVGKAAASTRRSPYTSVAAKTIEVPDVGVVDVQSDSRWTEIAPGQPLVVKLSGEGCAALVTFRRR